MIRPLSAAGKYLLALLACVAGSMITPARAAEATFSLRIKHGQVPKALRVLRVKQGDFVRLLVSTDRTATLHLHGYDIEREVKPGTVTEFAFKAYATGRFPMHLHGQHEQSGAHEEAPLVYIEVYPR
jgi:FtsP/CotA-like multicopper oxidase with cupredoxin domain